MARSCKHYGCSGRPYGSEDPRTRTAKPPGNKARNRTATKKNYKVVNSRQRVAGLMD
jgi:hypothetical protein